ncbi:DUF2905 domain-containing protein [uncultured Pseudacidovorax sp.]|uniref:DUF2905 domain-containing protein n=1 Tax=uncultured Pseudacidovorax sp. TaxID=679313 RepID=UPI0025F07885|nr:DUF2905 domain-containing protein [uncultured Pseudacidovorax sp.]
MLRWLLVTILALLLLQGFTGWLRKLGFGRLPGDFEFKLFGRVWQLPVASTVVLSMIAAGVARLL